MLLDGKNFVITRVIATTEQHTIVKRSASSFLALIFMHRVAIHAASAVVAKYCKTYCKKYTMTAATQTQWVLQKYKQFFLRKDCTYDVFMLCASPRYSVPKLSVNFKVNLTGFIIWERIMREVLHADYMCI